MCVLWARAIRPKSLSKLQCSLLSTWHEYIVAATAARPHHTKLFYFHVLRSKPRARRFGVGVGAQRRFCRRCGRRGGVVRVNKPFQRACVLTNKSE